VRRTLVPQPLLGSDWRGHFGVWAAVAGLAFVALMLAAPRAGSAPFPGGAAALDPAASAAWLVLGPLAAGFPLGDAQAHLRLLSVAAAAATLSLLLWRATDPEQVRREQPPAATEIVATGFGVLAVALSRGFFHTATDGGPGAIGALWALGLLALVERTWRAPGDVRAGVGLAAIAGTAGGGPMIAAALGWPLAAVVMGRAWRRRARWFAPATVLCAASAVFALAVVLRAAGWSRFGQVARHLCLVPVVQGLARLTMPAMVSAAGDLVDQIGVVGIMVAATGLTRLRPHALFFSLWPLAGGLVLSAAQMGGGPARGGSVGLVVALAALALPIGVGTARLAERLGRAALPATAAIGVIVSTWPLLAR
jgi:hypothetical protein